MIEVESVSFRFPYTDYILRDVSLEIKSGELVAIVGANGSGKTTLIKHFNGIYKPTKGVVRVFNRDTREASVAELSRKVGIVFQNPNHQLFAETVEEEIMFALRNFGFGEEVVRRRTEWALKSFNLEGYRKRSPFHLSEGEKKRLCLAAVLSWDPTVIVLDEPTVGFDFFQRENLLQILEVLRRGTGKTIVIVSHDVEFLWNLQPRTIVLSRGRVVMDESFEKVFRSEKIEEAGLIKPQVIQLFDRIFQGDYFPPRDVYEAAEWIVSKLGGSACEVVY